MPAINFDFRVIGAETVNSALAGIERRAARINRAAGGGSGQRGPWSAGNRPLNDTEKLAMKVARDQERAALRAARAWDKYQQSVGRAQAQASRNADKELAKQVRAHERAAEKQTRATQRELQKQARMAEQNATHRARLMGHGVMRGLSTVGRFAGGALALGGGMTMYHAIEREKDYDKSIRNFINQAGPQLGTSKRAAFKEIRGQAFAVGQRYGIAAQEPLAGAAAFGEVSGEYQLGLQLMDKFAKVSVASGTEMVDVAMTAGNAMKNLQARGIQGQEALGQLDIVLRGLVQQGRAGSVEFKDFADQFAKISGAAMSIPVGDPGKNMLMLAGMAQWAKGYGGAPNAEVATTSVLQLVSAMQKPVFNKKLGQMEISPGTGISPYVYENVGGKQTAVGLRSPMDVLSDMFQATGGDISVLGSMFNERARKAADPFFRRATEISIQEGVTPTEAWEKMRKSFDKFNTTIIPESQLDEDARFAAEGATATWTKFTDKIAQEFGPKLIGIIEKLIPAFEKLVPVLEKLAGLAEKAAENPKTAAAAMVGLGAGSGLLGGIFEAGMTGMLVKSMLGGGGLAGLGTGAATAGVPGFLGAMLSGKGLFGVGTNLLGGLFGGVEGFNLASAFGMGGDASDQTSGRHWLTAGGAYTGAIMGAMNPLALATHGISKYVQSEYAGGGAMNPFGSPDKAQGGIANSIMAAFPSQEMQGLKGIVDTTAAALKKLADSANEAGGGLNRGASPKNPSPTSKR